MPIHGYKQGFMVYMPDINQYYVGLLKTVFKSGAITVSLSECYLIDLNGQSKVADTTARTVAIEIAG